MQVYVLEDLFSPLITPYRLFCISEETCKDIVEFFANYTASLDAVGSICSFSQLDIGEHGSAEVRCLIMLYETLYMVDTNIFFHILQSLNMYAKLNWTITRYQFCSALKNQFKETRMRGPWPSWRHIVGFYSLSKDLNVFLV